LLNVSIRCCRANARTRLAKLFTEKSKKHTHRISRQCRVVTRPLIAQESVGRVEFVPFEIDFSLIQSLVYELPSLQRHMRILPTPDKKVGGAGSREALKSIVAFSRPKGVIVDVRRIKRRDGLDILMKSGANGQMPAQTDAETRDSAVAF
jgi:hypothetical protein